MIKREKIFSCIVFIYFIAAVSVQAQPSVTHIEAPDKPDQVAALASPQPNADVKTICNPLNLSYRYMPEAPSRREAADPTVIFFKDDYYLFASKSGGYWWSHDLIDWHLVETDQIPVEDYAPTAVAISDTMYFLASSSKKCPIYKSADPKSGRWQLAKDSLPFTVTDPALFLDDDQKLYLYWGCSPTDSIHGVELDKETFEPIGAPKNLIIADTKNHGWENPGDYNELTRAPWIEGPAMNKYNGKYYLQYAAPGTEFFSYADGVYTSDKPLGPFIYAHVNPFSYKPGGFIRGAGHGSTFRDRYGNYWHAATMTISVLHIFERRIGLFPSFINHEGNLVAEAGITDYPIIIPDRTILQPTDVSTGWMLLSHRKHATAFTSLQDFPPDYAVDENVRTSWSAKTGNRGEWFQIDLGQICKVHAIQINYADQATSIFARDSNCYYQYLVEYSVDTVSWHKLIDRTSSRIDTPHDYTQLPVPVDARYVRLTNYHVPGGRFSLSDFRIFGRGTGNKPGAVKSFNIIRQKSNRCIARLSWSLSKAAEGYMVRFGTNKSLITCRYPVYTDTCLIVRSLNANEKYYFTIDSFNENGFSGTEVIQIVP